MDSAYLGKKKYIFISYAHADSKKAKPIIEAFQARFNIWYDGHISAGSQWRGTIAERLAHCSVFVFLISNHSLRSENCKKEISFASEKGIPFVGIEIEPRIRFTDEYRLYYDDYQRSRFYEYRSPALALDCLIEQCSYFHGLSKDNSYVPYSDPATPTRYEEEDDDLPRTAGRKNSGFQRFMAAPAGKLAFLFWMFAITFVMVDLLAEAIYPSLPIDLSVLLYVFRLLGGASVAAGIVFTIIRAVQMRRGRQ